MKTTRPDPESRREWGTIFLSLGLLGVLLLVAQGVLMLRHHQPDEPPDMGHLNYALTGMFVGPVAVLLVILGLVLRRRRIAGRKGQQ